MEYLTAEELYNYELEDVKWEILSLEAQRKVLPGRGEEYGSEEEE